MSRTEGERRRGERPWKHGLVPIIAIGVAMVFLLLENLRNNAQAVEASSQRAHAAITQVEQLAGQMKLDDVSHAIAAVKEQIEDHGDAKKTSLQEEVSRLRQALAPTNGAEATHSLHEVIMQLALELRGKEGDKESLAARIAALQAKLQEALGAQQHLADALHAELNGTATIQALPLLAGDVRKELKEVDGQTGQLAQDLTGVSGQVGTLATHLSHAQDQVGQPGQAGSLRDSLTEATRVANALKSSLDPCVLNPCNRGCDMGACKRFLTSTHAGACSVDGQDVLSCR